MFGTLCRICLGLRRRSVTAVCTCRWYASDATQQWDRLPSNMFGSELNKGNLSSRKKEKECPYVYREMSFRARPRGWWSWTGIVATCMSTCSIAMSLEYVVAQTCALRRIFCSMSMLSIAYEDELTVLFTLMVGARSDALWCAHGVHMARTTTRWMNNEPAEMWH